MITLAAWLHDLDPFALRLSGEFGIRWYGLSYVAAFVIGWLILRAMGRRGLAKIPPQHALDAMMIVILGTIVGGRVGYCLVYDPSLFTSVTGSFPFWGVLAIHRGGMASHGGLIGLCVAAWWVARGFKGESDRRLGASSTLHVMDCLAVMAPPGLLLGRLANFINGELLGAVVSPPGRAGPWWSVMFPQELRGWVAPGVRATGSHTPELDGGQRRILWDLVLDAWAATSVADPAQTRERAEGLLLSGGADASETWQNGIEMIVANPSRHAEGLVQILASRHPSQLYQGVAEGLVLGIALWCIWAKPRVQGVIAAWFFIIYGVLRILTEVWRLPDAQFVEGRPFGLSRGQWLSAGMIAAGVGLLFFAIRRGREKVGGWAERQVPHSPTSPASAAGG
ncbi:MAG: prolipoprotein diacylglyceryl transferase [Phycisphaerales bacterium]